MIKIENNNLIINLADLNLLLDKLKMVREKTNPSPWFNPLLLSSVEDLDFTVRTTNVLRYEEIIFLGDLIQCSSTTIKSWPNAGRKTLNEIINRLKESGFELSSQVENWNFVRDSLIKIAKLSNRSSSNTEEYDKFIRNSVEFYKCTKAEFYNKLALEISVKLHEEKRN